MEISSFDIFDTSLIRACGTEENLFHILAYNILGDDADLMKIIEFVRIRKTGEKTARLLSQFDEITTENIYEQTDFRALTDIPNSVIYKKELSIQENLLFPVKQICDIIKCERNKGKQIIFISDMHLPQELLKRVLIKNELFFEEVDKIYVSSFWKKTKFNGKLFDTVKADINNRITSWNHYGDNVISDFKIPRKKSIKSKIIRLSKIKSYNVNIETDYLSNPCSILNSISQTTFLLKESEYRKLISGIIAPVFVSFVYKIMCDAQSRNIKKIYFFARDAYVFYIISQQFQSLFPELECKYLYVSRRTLYLPSIENISADSFLMLKEIKSLSIEDYLDQFGIDANQLNINNNISDTKLQFEELFRDSSNNDKIRTLRDNSIINLEGYLNQEGFLSHNNDVAFVDMTGSRSSQFSINKFLFNHKYNKVYAYYFLVSSDRKSNKEAGDFYAPILTDFANKTPWKCLGDITLLLEDVFSITNQSRTKGYELIDNKYIPIYEQSKEQARNEVFMNENLNIYIQFSKMYILCKSYLYNTYILNNSIYRLSLFSENPKYSYVKCLEKFSFYENVNSKQMIVSRPWRSDFKRSWFRGSIVAISPIINLILSLIIKIKRK